MVKHTQKIRLQQPMNWSSVFNHFVGLALEGLIGLKAGSHLTCSDRASKWMLWYCQLQTSCQLQDKQDGPSSEKKLNNLKTRKAFQE